MAVCMFVCMYVCLFVCKKNHLQCCCPRPAEWDPGQCCWGSRPHRACAAGWPLRKRSHWSTLRLPQSLRGRMPVEIHIYQNVTYKHVKRFCHMQKKKRQKICNLTNWWHNFFQFVKSVKYWIELTQLFKCMKTVDLTFSCCTSAQSSEEISSFIFSKCVHQLSEWLRRPTGWYLGGESFLVVKKTMAQRKRPIRRNNSQRGNWPWILWVASKCSKNHKTSCFFFPVLQNAFFFFLTVANLHCPDWKANTHTRGAVTSWRQLSGRLQFLSSLSGSTTGMHRSSSTSIGIWRVEKTSTTLFTNVVSIKPDKRTWGSHSPTFMTFNTLQLHGFLLHFLLSRGFRELSRMWAVDAEFGKSDPYSDPEKHTRVISGDLHRGF